MTSNPDVPPFTGYVETTVNALRLIHAARQGVIPRITRRLNDSERRTMIKSGAVFVFSVEESGIKRWTDGLLWSPSRIVGNFLVYREINERTSSRSNHKKPSYPGDDSPTRALARKSSPDQMSMGFKGGSDQGTFKVGGLIKKTITVTIEGSDLHLISYYTSEDVRSRKLKKPSSRHDIMSLSMPPNLFRLTNFRVPPKIEIGPDGKPRLAESEEVDSVECKVEEHVYHPLASSPNWSHQGSPASPVEHSFSNNSMAYVSSNQNGAGVYRGQDSMNRQDLVSQWSPSTSTLTSGHTMRRRIDNSILQSDSWQSLGSQPSRWGTNSHDDSNTSSGNGYSDRPRLRNVHPYDEGGLLQQRRVAQDNMGTDFSLRYPVHGSRESALQRLHWHPRDTPDNSRDLRRASVQNVHFSNSPNVPFASQTTYQATNTPTYTSSWTPTDPSLLTTPTLHSVTSQSAISYDTTSYQNTGSTLSSPDDFSGGVEEFRGS
ncbi:Gti1/Pac2 family-domain-containing protein [Panaeolus papilionaceus]|nr:Gti1/Pac2 family-domain-containing protein [Panaeolus papilionaceus]